MFLFRLRSHSEASSRMVGDERRLVKLMTSGSERIARPEGQRVRDHLSMVIRSELPLRDKVSLLGALAVQTCRRRERLLRDNPRVARADAHMMTSAAPVQSFTNWRRSVRNVVANWASFVIGAMISLVLSPFIIHSLGDGAYGAWVLLSSLVGYLGLLDLGTRGAVTRYVATYHAAHRHEDAGRIASTALVLFGGLGLLAIAASVLLALLVNHAFQVPAELAEVIRIAIVLGGVNIAVSLVSGVFGGIIVGMQRFDTLNAVNIVLALARAVAVVLVLHAGGGLVGLALVQLGVSVLSGGVSAWLSYRVYPELAVRASSWSRLHLREIFSFGISSALLNAADSVINYANTLLIGAFLPVEMITFFAIASTMTDHVGAVIAGISYTFTPMVGALEGQRRGAAVAEVCLHGARFATLAVLPIVVTLELRGASFIGIWMGPAYAGPAGTVLTVLALPVLALAGFRVVTATMIGINQHRGLIPVFACEAVMNVLLSIALVRYLGIVGVAWGMALPRVIVSLFVGPLYIRRHARVPLRAYWTQTLLRPAVGMIPFALVTWATEMWWPASNIWGFFGQVLTALPVAALGAWFVVLTSSERHALGAALAMPGFASTVK
jgi:O-antigen/teichoic acid export membrane protein